MQTYPYGAHEVLELHEVLNAAIDACNTLQLFGSYVHDLELKQMLTAQLQFMQNEYNSMVHLVQGVGIGAAVPYRANVQLTPSAVAKPLQTQPHSNAGQMDDRDVASVMLGLHKSGAKLKMSAALEAANPQIRNVLLQSAINCANQAYEVWGFMQRRGYYPLATLHEADNAQLLRGYQPIHPDQPAAQMHAAPMDHSGIGTGLRSAVEPSSLPPQQTGTIAGDQPLPTPKSSVNASHIFSSPTYRQEHYATETDQTAMVHEGPSPQMGDPLAALTSQTDIRTTRGTRKKGAGSDDPITG
ncbi:spore coat protein [Brevibacillus sp. H7]|uniref:spore coat protein n=1 Tax=Brevibacillus sp. H7 TaxID=3349138 RepID=UPI00382D0F7A